MTVKIHLVAHVGKAIHFLKPLPAFMGTNSTVLITSTVFGDCRGFFSLDKLELCYVLKLFRMFHRDCFFFWQILGLTFRVWLQAFAYSCHVSLFLMTDLLKFYLFPQHLKDLLSHDYYD